MCRGRMWLPRFVIFKGLNQNRERMHLESLNPKLGVFQRLWRFFRVQERLESCNLR